MLRDIGSGPQTASSVPLLGVSSLGDVNGLCASSDRLSVVGCVAEAVAAADADAVRRTDGVPFNRRGGFE